MGPYYTSVMLQPSSKTFLSYIPPLVVRLPLVAGRIIRH